MVVDTAFGKLDISSSGVIYTEGFADIVGGGTEKIFLLGENKIFNFCFQFFRQFISGGGEDFYSVITCRIMGGCDHDPAIRTHGFGKVRYCRSRQWPDFKNIHPGTDKTAGESGFQHIA